MLPNEIFNMDLSSGEIALYAFLMRMEDRKTYSCYPSFKTIGNALRMSKNTVMKYVRLLEEKELIKTERTIVEHHDGSKCLLVLHKPKVGTKIGWQTGESNGAVWLRRCGSQRPATPTASRF